MATHLFGYIAVILIQQLMIVGLAFGIVQLFDRQRHLRRLNRTADDRNSAELKLTGHELGSPQPEDLLSEPAMDLQISKDVRLLTSVDA